MNMKKLWRSAAAAVCTAAVALSAACAPMTAKPIALTELDSDKRITVEPGTITNRTVVKTTTTIDNQGVATPVATEKTVKQPVYETRANPKHAEWEAKSKECAALLEKLGAPEAKGCINPGKEPAKTIRVVVGHKDVTVPVKAEAPAAPATKVTTVVQEVTRETEGGPLVVGVHIVGGNILDMQAIETFKKPVAYEDLKKGEAEEGQTVGGASRAAGVAGLVGAAAEVGMAGAAIEMASKYKPDSVTNNVSANAEACAESNAWSGTEVNIKGQPPRKIEGHSWSGHNGFGYGSGR